MWLLIPIVLLAAVGASGNDATAGLDVARRLENLVCFEVHRGTAVSSIPGWEFPPEYTFHLLSDGATRDGVVLSQKTNFGPVYLVEPPEGTPFVLKVYEHSTTCARDLGTLNLLAEMLKGDQDPDSFRIATAEPTRDSKTMKLGYFPGRDLTSVLEDPQIPLDVRTKLLNDYNRRVAKLVAKVGKKGEFINGKWSFTRMSGAAAQATGRVYGPDGSSHPVNITTNQVIVDPRTFEMTIIDPQ